MTEPGSQERGVFRMRQPGTRPFVYPDPVPTPLSECSSLPTASPFDTSVEKVALVEVASPILALASIVWEANLDGHGSRLQS